jgi:hypothetical protein
MKEITNDDILKKYCREAFDILSTILHCSKRKNKKYHEARERIRQVKIDLSDIATGSWQKHHTT